jgi:hypothetical protein
MLLLGFWPLFAQEQPTHSFEGWVDFGDFEKGKPPAIGLIQTDFKVDTTLVDHHNWERFASEKIRIKGFFTKNNLGEPIFKILAVQESAEAELMEEEERMDKVLTEKERSLEERENGH